VCLRRRIDHSEGCDLDDSIGTERLTRLGVVPQDLGRIESLSVHSSEAIEGRNDRRGPYLVDVEERAATERRDSQPEDGGNVAVPR
jgi:hypothetical protein